MGKRTVLEGRIKAQRMTVDGIIERYRKLRQNHVESRTARCQAMEIQEASYVNYERYHTDGLDTTMTPIDADRKQLFDTIFHGFAAVDEETEGNWREIFNQMIKRCPEKAGKLEYPERFRSSERAQKRADAQKWMAEVLSQIQLQFPIAVRKRFDDLDLRIRTAISKDEPYEDIIVSSMVESLHDVLRTE